MKILILDDSEKRVQVFKGLYPNDEITWIDSVTELKETKIEQFQRIFLDHDLGIKKGSGIEAADYLKAFFSTKRVDFPEIIIHSMNIAKAGEMERRLNGCFCKVSRAPMYSLILQQRIKK